MTDDDLRAIRARVEAWRKNQSLWGPVETELTRDIMVNLDIPALLAHADALAAENDALRDALAALVDAEAHGTPGGYIGVDPSGETYDRHCTYCYTSWQLGEPERHDTDCPIASARRVLDGSA